MVTDDYKSRIISSFYQDIMMIIRWEASIGLFLQWLASYAICKQRKFAYACSIGKPRKNYKEK